MSPRSFGITDLCACIIAGALLLFLFIYPHVRLKCLAEDVCDLCVQLTEAANTEEWEKARMLSNAIYARLDEDKVLLRLVIDHEDIDNASDAVYSAILMAEREDGTETVIETENIRSIVTYLSGIETFSLTNLF